VRPDQEADVVEMNWLVHSGSFIEMGIYHQNEMKDNFAAVCRLRQIKEIQKKAAEWAEEAEKKAKEDADWAAKEAKALRAAAGNDVVDNEV
jgi:hypothetical protein